MYPECKGNVYATGVGPLAARAWGAGLIIDCIEEGIGELAKLNPENSAVTGFSFLGKTALVTGVLEDRIKVTNPAHSGVGGAAPFRYSAQGKSYTTEEYGFEKDHLVTKIEPIGQVQGQGMAWVKTIFADFLGGDCTPFDTYMLLSLVAPRGLIVSAGYYDNGTNPEGMYAAYVQAKEVYKFLGIEGKIAFGDYPTDHANSTAETNDFFKFCDYVMYGKELPEDFYATVFDNSPDKAEYDVIRAPYKPKNGFVEEDGTTYYYINDKKAYAGLIDVDGLFYYIKGNGEVAKGSYYISNGNGIVDKGHAQFDETTGKMLINGIKKVYGEDRYYVDGVLQKDAGVVKVGAYFYYVDEEGKVVKASEIEVVKTGDRIPAGTYKATEKGVLILEGVVAVDGETAYYKNNKKAHRAGLVEYNGDYYYVIENGALATGFVTVKKTNDLKEFGTYEFAADGKMIMKNGLVDEEGSTYYYVEGRRGYAGLVKIGEDLYYVKGTGEIAKGHYYISNTNGLIDHKDHAIFGEDGKFLRFGKK